jgi:hypothetical protein
MSYRIDFALDAQTEWRKLPVAVQEAVLDEMDRLSGADALPTTIYRGHHDFVFEVAGTRHYVFLSMSLNTVTRSLSVLSVGYFARSA